MALMMFTTTWCGYCREALPMIVVMEDGRSLWLARGTPREIRDEVRRRCDDLAPGGGFILSTGDQCGRDTPDANIFAMVEAAKQFGEYPLDFERIFTDDQLGQADAWIEGEGFTLEPGAIQSRLEATLTATERGSAITIVPPAP